MGTTNKRLTTAEVARRLEVKPETVYAYVSRGILRSVKAPDGKGSLFDAAEVERLAGQTVRRGRRAERGPSIHSAITLIKDGRLYYRGHDAAELAGAQTFEAVAGLLWTGSLETHQEFAAPADVVELARRANEPLPPATRLTDRLRVIAAVAAAVDAFRFNTQPDAVRATAATLLATMVDALPPQGEAAPPRQGDGLPGEAEKRLAARLWPRLTAQAPSAAGLAALNAALVLLADHGLATSTFAARVAASSRAHPYAVVAAGLSAFDGPLHGAAATHAYRLLADAIATGDPTAVFAERLRTEGHVEGFFPATHPHYPDGDIRASALMEFMRTLRVPIKTKNAIEGLIAAAARRSPHRPSIEFALAVLVHACGMRPDAGEAVFAIARTAGWIAHALEEYEEPGLRFRREGSYVGEPVS